MDLNIQESMQSTRIDLNLAMNKIPFPRIYVDLLKQVTKHGIKWK